MQSLPVQIATAFVGDALALVNGFARIVTNIVMTPVERIANACDVAGLLEQRAARDVERERLQHAWRELSANLLKPHASRRHRGRFGCLRLLGELT